MKRLTALLLALLMLLSVMTGCGSKEEAKPAEDKAPAAEKTEEKAEAPAEEAEEQEEVEITFWHYSGQYDQYDADFEAFCDKVTEKYPYIKINAEMLSYDSGPEKFTVALGTGGTPDLYWDAYSRIAPAVGADLLVDVSDVVADVADLAVEGSQTIGMVDGKNMTVNTHQMSGYFVCVNKDMAERLGVLNMFPEDGIHWSYDEFLAMCKAVREADSSVYPCALWAGTRSADAWYYTWLMTGGTDLTNEDLTATAFNTPEAVETLNVLKTIVDEGYCMPGAATAKDEELYPLFYNQQTMMLAGGTLQDAMLCYSTLEAQGFEEFEIMPVAMPTPDGKSEPDSASFGANSFAIFKNNNDPAKIDACKKIVAMFFEDPTFAKSYASLSGNPTTVLAGQPEWSNEKHAALGEWCIDYTGKYSRCDFGILEPWWTSFRETFYVELQGLYNGTQSAQELLDNWQKNADAVIAEATGG